MHVVCPVAVQHVRQRASSRTPITDVLLLLGRRDGPREPDVEARAGSVLVHGGVPNDPDRLHAQDDGGFRAAFESSAKPDTQTPEKLLKLPVRVLRDFHLFQDLRREGFTPGCPEPQHPDSIRGRGLITLRRSGRRRDLRIAVELRRGEPARQPVPGRGPQIGDPGEGRIPQQRPGSDAVGIRVFWGV